MAGNDVRESPTYELEKMENPEPVMDSNQEQGKESLPQPNIAKHAYSDPWKDSDVVLLIEGERFHVHRLMLSIHSPVFEVMFNSEFKEQDATQIELPDKKASEFVDLLNEIYPHKMDTITMDNVSHILSLADEYQMIAVIKNCTAFLARTQKNKDNAMKIVLLAQKYRLNDGFQGCFDLLHKVPLEQLKLRTEFEQLDGSTTRKLLVPRLEGLKKFIKELHPQFVGITECALYLALGGEKAKMELARCCTHFRIGANPFHPLRYRLSCPSCQTMFGELNNLTNQQPSTRVTSGGYGGFGGFGDISKQKSFSYGCSLFGEDLKFNDAIVNVHRQLQEFLETL